MRPASVALLAILLFPLAFAATSSSENYNQTSLKVSDGGGSISSSSYRNIVTIGGINEEVSSSSYQNFLGFFHTWLLADGQYCTADNQCEGGFCCSNACGSSACGGGDDGGDTGTSSSGGGGGGGGGFLSVNQTQESAAEDFSISPDPLTFDLELGQETSQAVTIENTGDLELDLTLALEGLENFTTFTQTSIQDLASGSSEDISIDVLARQVGSYLGDLTVQSEGLTKTSGVILNIESAGALFDVSLDILPRYTILEPGDELRAQVTMFNVGTPRQTDVLVTYILKDTRGQVLFEESESFAVLREAGYSYTFSLPPNIQYGRYLAGIEVRYEDSFAVSSAMFEVVEDKGHPLLRAIVTPANVTFFLSLLVLSGILYAATTALLSRRKAPRKGKRRKR